MIARNYLMSFQKESDEDEQFGSLGLAQAEPEKLFGHVIPVHLNYKGEGT